MYDLPPTVPAVPEASPAVSLGLLLTLGGFAVEVRRKLLHK